MSVSVTLDSEFKRVAREEDISIEQLVNEVATATDYTTRQIYNFRSGKWSIPCELIPYFVARFKSHNILNALITLCERIPVEIPEQCDIVRLSLDSVRSSLNHHDKFLAAFSDEKITKREFVELTESSEQVIMMVSTFLSIVKAAYEAQHPKEKIPRFSFAGRGKAHRSAKKL